jgi:hypothetical protein
MSLNNNSIAQKNVLRQWWQNVHTAHVESEKPRLRSIEVESLVVNGFHKMGQHNIKASIGRELYGGLPI